MALGAGSIDTTYLVLYDLFAGVVLGHSGAEPGDGFTSAAAHHNQSATRTGQYKAGSKFVVYDATNDGYAVLTYLKMGTASGVAIAAGAICTTEGSTANTTPFHWYQVNNDPDDTLLTAGHGACAIAISAMTDTYWGWFWTGGVCPENAIAALKVSVKTYFDAANTGNFNVAVGDGNATDENGFIATAAGLQACGYITTIATAT